MKTTTTTHQHHKTTRTQIISQVIGHKDVPIFGQWTVNEKGEKVPKTWKAPIVRRKVIHHEL